MPHPTMTPLATDFFARFARFEFALRQDARFRSFGGGLGVKVEWDAFANLPEISALMDDLRSDPVANYIIENPPQRRVLRDWGLDWEPQPKPETMVSLCRRIKDVRNNLFHGDKANPGLSRNVDLFNASMGILDAMLNAYPEIKMRYEEGLDMA